jgi:hypothetical protein
MPNTGTTIRQKQGWMGSTLLSIFDRCRHMRRLCLGTYIHDLHSLQNHFPTRNHFKMAIFWTNVIVAYEEVPV